MQANPYRLIEELGTSTVGQVWSAVDANGRRVTVAVLDSLVASDPQWREAFAAAARARGAAGLQLVSSDFSGSAPWAAFAATEDGPGAEEVFRALGVEYQPASDRPVSPASEQPAASTTQEAKPTSGATPALDPTPAAGAASAPGLSIEHSIPIFVPPTPAPTPTPPAERSMPILMPAVAPAEPRVDESDQRTRLGRWFAILGVFALAVVVVVGAALIAVRTLPLAGETASPSAPPTPVETTRPPQPGLEPPLPGNWPQVWAGFTPDDKPRTFNLEGLPFPLHVPSYWNCALIDPGPESIRYNCSGPINDDQDIGGEIVVQECPVPCDAVRRDAMRAVEDAWGQQWRYAGPNATIAETLKLYGQDQTYGLVILGYFPSRPNGPIDRQIALRMSSPESWLSDIRKVAVSLRNGAKL
jgi:hypothetical protein